MCYILNPLNCTIIRVKHILLVKGDNFSSPKCEF